jgi:hypothetical protein
MVRMQGLVNLEKKNINFPHWYWNPRTSGLKHSASYRVPPFKMMKPGPKQTKMNVSADSPAVGP